MNWKNGCQIKGSGAHLKPQARNKRRKVFAAVCRFGIQIYTGGTFQQMESELDTLTKTACIIEAASLSACEYFCPPKSNSPFVFLLLPHMKDNVFVVITL